MVKINYNRILVILFAIGSIFFVFTAINVAKNQFEVQENNKIDEMLEIEGNISQSSTSKVIQPSQNQKVLGWEIGDQKGNFNAIAATITVVCMGIYENTVLVVDTAIADQYTETSGTNLAKFFQERIYDATAEVFGVPRESSDYGTNDIVICLINRNHYSVSWVGVYAGQPNGYEQITCHNEGPDWETVAHEYQHCIHRNVREKNSELWINEGMSELWPNFLRIKTTNRSADRFMESVESGYGQNMPLKNFIRGGLPQNSASYGISFIFTYYIWEKFGMEFLTSVIRDYNYSIHEGFDRQLAEFGYEMTFEDIFYNFEIAMRLNDPTINHYWGFNNTALNIMPDHTVRATDLPVTVTDKVYHWGGYSSQLSLSSPTFSALKYEFNGSTTGNFSVSVIGSSYYNYSYNKKYISQMEIDKQTQDGSLIYILPEKVNFITINIANANGPLEGYIVSSSEVLMTIRDEMSFKVDAFDPGLVGSLDTANYLAQERQFEITASLSWDLEETIHEAGLRPHVTLYDKDGEFAFNVQISLIYDSDSGKWIGTLSIPDDIAKGDYKLKLFIQGAEIDVKDVKVGGVSAPSFLFFSFSIALVTLVFLRKRKYY